MPFWSMEGHLTDMTVHWFRMAFRTVRVESGYIWLWSNFYLQICSSMCSFCKLQSYTRAECSKLCLYVSYTSTVGHASLRRHWSCIVRGQMGCKIVEYLGEWCWLICSSWSLDLLWRKIDYKSLYYLSGRCSPRIHIGSETMIYAFA